MADLAERLRKEKDELSAAHELVTQRVEKLIAENGDLNVNNATLKVRVGKRLARGNHFYKSETSICCP